MSPSLVLVHRPLTFWSIRYHSTKSFPFFTRVGPFTANVITNPVAETKRPLNETRNDPFLRTLSQRAGVDSVSGFACCANVLGDRGILRRIVSPFLWCVRRARAYHNVLARNHRQRYALQPGPIPSPTSRPNVWRTCVRKSHDKIHCERAKDDHRSLRVDEKTKYISHPIAGCAKLSPAHPRDRVCASLLFGDRTVGQGRKAAGGFAAERRWDRRNAHR